MTSMRVVVFGFLVVFFCATCGAQPAGLARPLEGLRPFLGKTWKGHFKGSTPEKPNFDVMRWERALNGQAIRILHSVNNGIYGGETIVMWNPKRGAVESYYFTTAGFQTRGTIKAEGNKLTSVEQVIGDADGVTEVQATMELLGGDRLRLQSRYLKKGEWVEGRDMTYDPAPDAEVLFK